MTNGQGLDFGAMAQQARMQEAQVNAMVRAFVAETARDLYVKRCPFFHDLTAEPKEAYSIPSVEETKSLARQCHIAARYLAEEVFGIKFQEQEKQ